MRKTPYPLSSHECLGHLLLSLVLILTAIISTASILKGDTMSTEPKSINEHAKSTTTEGSASQAISPDFLPPQSYMAIEAITFPGEALRKIHDALLPFSTPYESTSNRSRIKSQKSTNILWLVSNGSISIHRAYDDLKVSVTSGPIVAGLGDLFEPIGRYYFRASRNSRVSYLPGEYAKSIITEKQLWQDVAEVLAFTVHMMIYRDEHLVSKTSYSIIRAKLIEYMKKREVSDLSRTGIVAYIQETTHLSRSLIYNIISQLAEGGYIKTSNGKLIEIAKPLPKNF